MKQNESVRGEYLGLTDGWFSWISAVLSLSLSGILIPESSPGLKAGQVPSTAGTLAMIAARARAKTFMLEGAEDLVSRKIVRREGAKG